MARIAYPTRAKAETIGPAPLRELPRELLPAVLRLTKPGQPIVVPRS